MRISTAYDDVFRTLVNDCAELIIPVINEVFGEHYTGEEEIRFSPNEHFINFQDGGEVSYQIPVVKTQKYTIDEIFEKKLLFLIPFYIFSHESRFKVYNTDEEKKNELIQEYAQIRYRLEELARQGQINEYMKCTILDMSNRVLEQIARNYDNVREGVRGIMVGKVLEYEAKTILRRGFSQGLSQGLYQGKKEEALNNARNFFLDGVKFETVRKNIKSLTEEELTEVYEDVQVQLRQSSKA